MAGPFQPLLDVFLRRITGLGSESLVNASADGAIRGGSIVVTGGNGSFATADSRASSAWLGVDNGILVDAPKRLLGVLQADTPFGSAGIVVTSGLVQVRAKRYQFVDAGLSVNIDIPPAVGQTVYLAAGSDVVGGETYYSVMPVPLFGGLDAGGVYGGVNLPIGIIKDASTWAADGDLVTIDMIQQPAPAVSWRQQVTFVTTPAQSTRNPYVLPFHAGPNKTVQFLLTAQVHARSSSGLYNFTSVQVMAAAQSSGGGSTATQTFSQVLDGGNNATQDLVTTYVTGVAQAVADNTIASILVGYSIGPGGPPTTMTWDVSADIIVQGTVANVPPT